MAGGLSEDIQGLFLLIARAALDQAPCPSDAEVARVCGSRSTGRAKRLLAYMESQGLLVCRNDLRGNRIIALPELGWTTAPGDAAARSDEHTSELQSLMRISYAVFCLKKKKKR